jgi:hypothetical protein
MVKKFKNPFTEEETRTLNSIIYRTFETIASELMACDGASSISRAEAIEVTLDAGYIETNLPNSCRGRLEDGKKLVARFRALSYDDQNSFCKENVFKFSRYN